MMSFDLKNPRLRVLLKSLTNDNRAKLFYNIIRYYLFSWMGERGSMAALDELKRLWENEEFLKCQGPEGGFTYIGLRREIEFYSVFHDKLHLIPALDAGCAYDFVGNHNGHFYCIDVTQNSDNKLNWWDVVTTPNGWKKIIAEINGTEMRFLCKPNQYNLKKKVSIENINPYRVSAFKPDYEFFVARHVGMNCIESGCPLSLVMEGLTVAKHIRSSTKVLLAAHLRFYTAYRQVLKLIPTLSCGDCTDFVGEESGKMVRYFVLTDAKGYGDKYQLYFDSMRGRRELCKTVVFSPWNQLFNFYSSNNYPQIDPDFDMPVIEGGTNE